jgi:hypothetical protein
MEGRCPLLDGTVEDTTPLGDESSHRKERRREKQQRAALARGGVDDRDRRLFWRLSQIVTRETRMVRRGRSLRRESAACLRIVVRPWSPDDGTDPLRVLAGAPQVKP